MKIKASFKNMSVLIKKKDGGEIPQFLVEGYYVLFPVVIPKVSGNSLLYAEGGSLTHENTEIPPHQYFPINSLNIYTEGSISELRIPGEPHVFHSGLYSEGSVVVFPIIVPRVTLTDSFYAQGFATTHENTEIPPHQYKEIKLIEMYTEGYGKIFPTINLDKIYISDMFVEGYIERR